MQKWEYLVKRHEPGFMNPSDTQDWLNSLGREGWELTDIQGIWVFFKRPLNG